MEIKDIIKSCRISLGLTQAQLAEAVGVSEATISRWESGDISNMKRTRIAALAKALQIPPSVIMGWEDEDALSSIGKKIVSAAGSISEARLVLFNLCIKENDINSMLYGGYKWTDKALNQLAAALGCSVDALKEEKAPDHLAEDLSDEELEIVSILRKMSPEQLARELAYLRQIPEGEQGK